MADVKRVSPEQARAGVVTGAALLVCAYNDEAKFRKYRLEGAISLDEFKEKVPALDRDKEIVFYCA